jgi:hypothetical protein
LAVLVGQPSEPGPYVIRVKAPAGVKLMPHRHPEDRIYTVMSGVFYIGLDGDKVKAYPPGSVIILPGDTPHFHWAKSGEYVTQVTAIGPLGSRVHGSQRRSASAKSLIPVALVMLRRSTLLRSTFCRWSNRCGGSRACGARPSRRDSRRRHSRPRLLKFSDLALKFPLAEETDAARADFLVGDAGIEPATPPV